MRSAPLKGDCIICQAPEIVRIAVNRAIWPDGGIVRAANYRSAGARAASQAAMTIDDKRADRFSELDPKTITRHADHIEASWKEFEPGDKLPDGDVPIATDFASVMEAGSRLGMKALAALEELVDSDPLAMAAFKTKEVIAMAKLGTVAASTKEASRLKRNQQAIDVAAIFAASSGHIESPTADPVETAADIDAMHAEVAEERRLLTEHAGT